MKHKEKSENRKALPKYLGILLIAALMGILVGIVIGVAGATNLPEKIQTAIYAFLRAFTPWSILVFSVVLLGAAVILYSSAKKQFAAWDGEEEESIEKAEEKLSWALLLAGLDMIAAFFFFGIGLHELGTIDRYLAVVLSVSFVLALAGTMVTQQKIVDLTRKMNPEKRGSIYDPKFQKKWMESCDENEQRQIGQAAYKAMSAVNNTCILLWAVLVVLGILFKIGVLAFFLVTFILAVSQTVYTLECIRLGRHRK